jgi:exopolyphosphatase/guanosine-5'-triphosphate,3'-diphosphate pyrophosphatase
MGSSKAASAAGVELPAMGSSKAASAAGVELPATRSQRRLAVLPGGDLRGPAERSQTVAVIDLGSNSWRLIVYRFMSGGEWRVLGQLHEPVRIAEGLTGSGRLSAAAIERGLETLEIFARYCRARGIGARAVDAVATSAVRDASNRDELLGRARALAGFDIRVLSVDEEARFGYLAAVNSTTLSDGVMLDLGGGSLQLVAVRDRQPQESGSWPLGAVCVTERFFPADGAPSRKQLTRARAAVRGELADARWLRQSGRRVVAIGGAVRNLATAAQRASGRDAAGIQGYVLGVAELRDLVRALAKRPTAARALPGIKTARADLILGAAVVLEAVLDAGAFDGLEVTRAGLREGVFFGNRLLPESTPLVPDVRAAAVRNLALQCDADLGHADHVAGLALQLHDSLVASDVITPAPDERELLWAAGMLHDVGIAIGYEGHAGHSHYVILNAGLPGHGPREVALIAQIVRYHRKGTPGLDECRPLAHDGDADLVARCALLLRIAEQLERGEGRSISAARLVADRRALRLELEGDDELARWSLERQLGDESFRRVFGRRLDLKSRP